MGQTIPTFRQSAASFVLDLLYSPLLLPLSLRVVVMDHFGSDVWQKQVGNEYRNQQLNIGQFLERHIAVVIYKCNAFSMAGALEMAV